MKGGDVSAESWPQILAGKSTAINGLMIATASNCDILTMDRFLTRLARIDIDLVVLSRTKGCILK